MRRITTASREPLFDTAATRRIETQAQAALPDHTLMDRAGLAVARLATALAPHARSIWVACGPGNNGGDGMRAAAFLASWARQGRGDWQVHLTHTMGPDLDPQQLPADSRHALLQAGSAGVRLHPSPPEHADLVVDALLGIGARQGTEGVLRQWQAHMCGVQGPVLAVDLPSGLNADTGAWSGPDLSANGPARHTLSLLTLKPGLFTADGRDASGTIWFDDLGVPTPHGFSPKAWLSPANATARPRLHRSHKGSHGDVIVIGGQHICIDGAGMTGAGVLAARAALESGAGRVYLALLGEPLAWDPVYPELMLRHPDRLMTSPGLSSACVVCGCGAGQAIAPLLPDVIRLSQRLVLDADALNAIACDPDLQRQVRLRQNHGQWTVITPHPLEAARLLGTDTSTVMADRLGAAEELADRLGTVCVLKGSGTVVASPGQISHINASGNARLATAGSGDVLAGMLGAALAVPERASLMVSVVAAVARHGDLADRWTGETLIAGRLAQALAQNGFAKGPDSP